MVLKKPYAFLIRYFRIIHLCLAIPILYLIGKTFAIVGFFRGYVSDNFTTSLVNIASLYVNFFMYLSLLVIIAFALSIYYLMRQKKKSTKLYFFTSVYYIFLFVMLGIVHSILSSMEHDVVTAQIAMAYRDISFAVCIPQYFLFIYTLLRGIGFDIKKFDFANDLKDLEITDIDSEEFEFAFNVESYKAKRTVRRFIREMKYYILENKFIFTCISAVVLIFIGTSIYLNRSVYNKVYHVNDKMTHNYLNVKVNNSIITNLGLNGEVIAKGKYYLALQLLIENRTNMAVDELDYNNFRLVLRGKNIYPTLDRGEFFIDYGIPYQKERIRPNTKNYYVLVYEIDEADLASSYTIKILEGLKYKVGEIAARYKNIVLYPHKVNSINEESVAMSETGNLKNSTLGLSTFKVNEYFFSRSYTYDYRYCYSDSNCTMLKDRITTDVSGTIEDMILLVLSMEYNLDPNSVYATSIRTDMHFFNRLFSLRYKKNGVEQITPLINRTTKNMENTLAFEADEDVSKSENIDLLLTVRSHRYVFKLR